MCHRTCAEPAPRAILKCTVHIPSMLVCPLGMPKRRRGGGAPGSWEISCARFGPAISELTLALTAEDAANHRRHNDYLALAIGAAAVTCFSVAFARSELAEVGGCATHLHECLCSLLERPAQALSIFEYACGTAALLALISVAILFIRKALASVVEGSGCFFAAAYGKENSKKSLLPDLQRASSPSVASACSSRLCLMTVPVPCVLSTLKLSARSS